MLSSPIRRLGLAVGAGAAALMLAACSGAAPAPGASGGPTGNAGGEPVELTFYTGTVQATVDTTNALVEAFMAKNPNIKITVDASGPGGTEGDNIIKTKLATGEMEDLFWYNSGALLQAVNPDQNLLNLADQEFVGRLNDSFVRTVSTDNGVYGVPNGTAGGGGIFYSKPAYDELGLSVPKTWDEFMANNEKLKAAGKVPVIQSYSDTWTSQIMVLADFFNVQANNPDWAEQYTAGQTGYATDPVAMQGFQHLEDLFKAGYLNEDFASTTFDEALNKVGAGEGVHYPMLGFAISTIVEAFPEARDTIGFFALPGDGPNGMTVWMPSAVYAPKTTEHPEEVKKFMDFVASPEGCDAITAAVTPQGPYPVEGCTIPDDVPQVVKDMLPYFEQENGTSPALEFLSPLKGPALEQITVEVGSGIRSAADGAKLYDEDVRKQAEQLGLPGW